MKFYYLLIFCIVWTSCTNNTNQSGNKTLKEESTDILKTSNTQSEDTTPKPKVITQIPKGEVPKVIQSPQEVLENVISNTSPNTIRDFNIEQLQTDDFQDMFPINKELFKIIYPNRDDYTSNTFYVYSHIPNKQAYHSLVIYQKNYEGEDYRVDYIELVNISKEGKQLDQFRLAAKDDAFIIYEVFSLLHSGTLIINEHISTEPNMETGIDTLKMNTYTIKLFGEKRVDTLKVDEKFVLIGE